MKDIEKKEQLLWWRKTCLETMKTALCWYQRTKDKSFIDYAKWFGGLSKDINNKLKKYD